MADLDEEELLRPTDAANYLGITLSRLNQIRKARQEVEQKFGKQIAGVWFYPVTHLDAYKTERDQHPKGGRPPGSKINAAVMTPVMVV
jgi:hypothetical protein